MVLGDGHGQIRPAPTGGARMSAPVASRPRQSRSRRLWLLVAAPLVVALLVVGTHLVLLPLVANRAKADYADGDYTSAEDGFASQQRFNWIEPWKAHYNTGTAYLRDNRPTALSDALVALDRAYALSAEEPPEVRCMVQTNLALAHEASGDIAMAEGDDAMADLPALEDALRARDTGQSFDNTLVRKYEGLFGSGVTAAMVEDDARTSYQKAAEDYATAEEVREQEGCPQAGPEKKKQNEDSTQRLQEKKQDAETSQPQDSDEDPTDDGTEPDDGTQQEPQTPQEKAEAERQEKLEKQNSEARDQEDQRQQEYSDTYGDDENGSGIAPKRW